MRNIGLHRGWFSLTALGTLSILFGFIAFIYPEGALQGHLIHWNMELSSYMVFPSEETQFKTLEQQVKHPTFSTPENLRQLPGHFGRGLCKILWPQLSPELFLSQCAVRTLGCCWIEDNGICPSFLRTERVNPVILSQWGKQALFRN